MTDAAHALVTNDLGAGGRLDLLLDTARDIVSIVPGTILRMAVDDETRPLCRLRIRRQQTASLTPYSSSIWVLTSVAGSMLSYIWRLRQGTRTGRLILQQATTKRACGNQNKGAN